LGISKVKQASQPLLVQAVQEITAVAAGGQHSGAISVHGLLYMWGRNQEGQCAQEIQKHPRLVAPTKV
jgi:alpha-tubulin suppressor-like RCC1 family protein